MPGWHFPAIGIVEGQSNVTPGSYGYPAVPLVMTGVRVPPAPAVAVAPVLVAVPPAFGAPPEADGTPTDVPPLAVLPGSTAAPPAAPEAPADPPSADGWASLWKAVWVASPQATAVTAKRKGTKPDRIAKFSRSDPESTGGARRPDLVTSQAIPQECPWLALQIRARPEPGDGPGILFIGDILSTLWPHRAEIELTRGVSTTKRVGLRQYLSQT